MASDLDPIRAPYGDHPSQYIERWGAAPGSSCDRAAVLFHGGYWRSRYGCDLMHPMARRLVANGWSVANLEYRRIGEADLPWEAMSGDIRAGLALAQSNQPTVFVGHSAGGHLALWAAATIPFAGLAGVVGLAPVTDVALADQDKLSNHVGAEFFPLGLADRRTALGKASPIELLPLHLPQLIVYGTEDDDVPESQPAPYVQRARQAGDPVDYHEPDGVDHFDVIDPSTAVWQDTEAWMNQVI